MLNKTDFESRLDTVTGYVGQMSLVNSVRNALPNRNVLGSDPGWLIARACMTPEECIAFGHDGRPWKFMRGRPDIAQRAIESCRSVVTKAVGKLGLECDWSRIGYSKISTGQQKSLAQIAPQEWSHLKRIIAKGGRKMDQLQEDICWPEDLEEKPWP